VGTTEIEKRIKVGKKFEVAHELGVELAAGVLGGLLPAVAARGAAPAVADGPSSLSSVSMGSPAV